MLAKEADIHLWTEWTAAQKTAWSNKQHPVPHLDPANAELINYWKFLGGEYSEQTGLFAYRPTWLDGALFGPTDLTLEDVRKSVHALGKGGNIWALAYHCGRLFLPPLNYHNPTYQYASLVIMHNHAEYVFLGKSFDSYTSIPGKMEILGMPNLRAVVCRFLAKNQQVLLTDAPKLELIRFAEIPATLNASGCPALNERSLQWMAESIAPSGGSVVELHPQAYARLTDGILEVAEENNITFAEA